MTTVFSLSCTTFTIIKHTHSKFSKKKNAVSDTIHNEMDHTPITPLVFCHANLCKHFMCCVKWNSFADE